MVRIHRTHVDVETTNDRFFYLCSLNLKRRSKSAYTPKVRRPSKQTPAFPLDGRFRLQFPLIRSSACLSSRLKFRPSFLLITRENFQEKSRRTATAWPYKINRKTIPSPHGLSLYVPFRSICTHPSQWIITSNLPTQLTPCAHWLPAGRHLRVSPGHLRRQPIGH